MVTSTFYYKPEHCHVAQHQVAASALEQPAPREAGELARHLLARAADAARDVVVRGRGLEARAVGVDAGDAREAQQLEPDAALHRLRAELVQALGELTHLARQAPQQALAHRGMAREQRAEHFWRHRGEQRFARRDHVGDARPAVDRRMLAEHFARRDVAQDDAPAPPGGRGLAHHAGDHEINVALRAVVAHDVLVALAARPFALRGDLAQARAAQALEQVHLLQPEQRRTARERALAARAGRDHLVLLGADYNSSPMDTLARIRQLAAKEFSINPDGLDPAAPLDTLGIDSLSFIEFMFKVEEEFGVSVSDEDLKAIKTLADLERHVAAALTAAGKV